MIYEIAGVSHELNSPDDISKMYGEKLKTIVMTDESGEVIGIGASVAQVQKSLPLLKSLKAQQGAPAHLRKVQQHRVLFKKSIASQSTGLNALNALVSELEAMQAARLSA